MASIFTFDPDPPRVSSPWATATPPPETPPRRPNAQDSGPAQAAGGANDGRLTNEFIGPPVIDYSSITRLEAEPQEGPTEYKLHLLLRRRRSFSKFSTKRHVSGSLRRTEMPTPAPVARSISDSSLLSSTPPALSATQSRQHRLEQLTTQLLWRLQQSCPYHISSSTAPVLPHFPDEAQLATPIILQQLYPGLEESRGALYEIGVADDGELVGLAEDEMEESLNNLRAMAASLGCRVEVQRRVPVGECEWVENAGTPQPKVHMSELLVAEAFVRPDRPDTKGPSSPTGTNDAPRPTEQLRVSLTGATMSGKTSLLGTLSTGTLDNGRGKSRLSLLRHRHEIETGVTSSITQELVGYRDVLDFEGSRTSTQVINYGSGDVSSWIDIHASVNAATAGRLVCLTDSAGHPRFRRTTVRGIVGWDPHYTLLCLPADTMGEPSRDIQAWPTTRADQESGAVEKSLAWEHLQLCLSMELSLVVVITKIDLLTTKDGLRAFVKKVLGVLKSVRRKGYISLDPSTTEPSLETIPVEDLLKTEETTRILKCSPLAAVPVILTSAVKGTGLSKLHAFLRELPVPPAPAPPAGSPCNLFHIEDIYNNGPGRRKAPNEPEIIGGHLRYGTLSIDDELLLGPYPVDTSSDDSDSGSGRPSARNSPVPTSRSFPGALNKRSHLISTSSTYAEWRRVRITSLRNLRLSVRTLYTGQVGTIGIVPIHGVIQSPAINRIRKGMVLASGDPKGHKVISVRFMGSNAEAVKSLSIGSPVFVYLASVRASSKVVSMFFEGGNDDDDGFAFGFGLDEDPVDNVSSDGAATVVTFQFIASREFVETDARVLVLPGGEPKLAGTGEKGEKGVPGFEGFVGRVVDGHG